MDILPLGAENMFSGQQKVEAIKPVEPIKKTGQEQHSQNEKEEGGKEKEQKKNLPSDPFKEKGNKIDVVG